jgi:hypothetical protein
VLAASIIRAMIALMMETAEIYGNITKFYNYYFLANLAM